MEQPWAQVLAIEWQLMELCLFTMWGQRHRGGKFVFSKRGGYYTFRSPTFLWTHSGIPAQPLLVGSFDIKKRVNRFVDDTFRYSCTASLGREF